MTTTGDFIETDTFDREYGLEELFPKEMVRELLGDRKSRFNACVLHADGRVYFGQSPLIDPYAAHINQPPAASLAQPAQFHAENLFGILFPLTHELETIGYLALETTGGETRQADVAAIGRMVARAIDRLCNLGYQYRMTASLHGEVVTDSYLQLQEKAEKLARSEEKYRSLAQSLEQEVARQTQAIEETQLRLLHQEKMAAIGQLAAGMAHEINNPVGFVISNLNTLKSNLAELAALIEQYGIMANLVQANALGPARVEKINRQIAVIETMTEKMDLRYVLTDSDNLIDESLDGAKRIKVIVENLREFTHPSVDTPESVDINQCLDTTLAMLSGFLTETVHVIKEYADLPQVRCRLRDINQALFNVLKNAVQAIDNSGQIHIRTRLADEMVCVEVSDNGVGIDPHHLGRVFDPFFTTRGVGQGIGLGLTQVYNTLKAHGGTISIESRMGEGSHVAVTLPIAGVDG